MRFLAAGILAICGACGEPQLVAKPLPPLAPPTSPLIELAAGPLGFAPGENLIWEVQARGMVIGRVELDVAENAITSHFKTTTLVSAFVKLEHDEVTFVDQGEPVSANESFDLDGTPGQYTIDLHGKVHSLHTALGALRAWAHEGARPVFMQVAVMNKHVTLQLEQPVSEGELLRVDGHIRGADEPISIKVWL